MAFCTSRDDSRSKRAKVKYYGVAESFTYFTRQAPYSGMLERITFDVFRVEKVGVSWLGSTSTVEEAHRKITDQLRYEFFEYTIVNTQTGYRTQVDFPDRLK